MKIRTNRPDTPDDTVAVAVLDGETRIIKDLVGMLTLIVVMIVVLLLTGGSAGG
ncbi:MAG: hypothetical protein MUF84_08035 [Anaerolineae bacterium]|jgi:hypothetical protein|nr:hypothetical protein [Anaerolineae bacterium]